MHMNCNIRKLILAIISFKMIIMLNACAVTPVAYQNDVCSNYPVSRSSQYILPYAKGEAYPIIQENCATQEHPWTHYGNLKFAYNFGMPVGTSIIAARAGTVVFVRDNFTDNDHGKNQGNAIVLLHEDGTYALYAHITNKGSKVKVGQIVKQGDRIAFSGNSGKSPLPHLHFQVNECGDFNTCQSIPVSFRNAKPRMDRLQKEMMYTAA
jgi:murein DD-endopeptidase MepM/ murein hydrolase activator NlpD